MKLKDDPVYRFKNRLLRTNGKWNEEALKAMCPALFSFAATGDGDLAAYNFLAALVFPAPPVKCREDILRNRNLQLLAHEFFSVVEYAIEGHIEFLALEKYWREGLRFPEEIAKVLATFAETGLGREEFAAS